MATLKQIDANRRNAQFSTGPITPEGKQTAALNALQTGIYAETEVLPTERPEDLRTLAAEYHNHHRPATPEARDLVDTPPPTPPLPPRPAPSSPPPSAAPGFSAVSPSPKPLSSASTPMTPPPPASIIS